MPAIVSLLALLSLAPLVVLAAGAIGSVSFVADRMLVALVDYVAVLLAFVGGTHWGLGLWPGSGALAGAPDGCGAADACRLDCPDHGAVRLVRGGADRADRRHPRDHVDRTPSGAAQGGRQTRRCSPGCGCAGASPAW